MKEINPTLHAIMLIGMPGSGKSTYISELKTQNPDRDYIVLSTDDILERLGNEKGLNYSQAFKNIPFKKVQAIFNNDFRQAINNESNIIIDQTNLTVKSRAKKLNKIPEEYKNSLTICESCKCLCRISNGYWSWTNDDNKIKVRKLGLVNAHHIIPVHTLTKDNLALIWDKNNLICLCPECHGKTMRKTKKINDFKKYRSLDYYIKKGS